MKTAKPLPSDLSSNRRAQPLRQTRNNPPRSSVAGSRQFGSRGSLGGFDGRASSPEQAIEIFPAITHFADAITALPKELVRHFTLLREVDAKIFNPEDDLGRLVDAALSAPLPERRPTVETHHSLGPTSAPLSAQGSSNGSMLNGHVGSATSIPDAVDAYAPTNAWDPANLPRRQLFQHLAYTMQNMLVSLDEKNHVISTAAESLNKQLARIDDCFPHVEDEISEEARYGSSTHWAYPENRTYKSGSGGSSRRDVQAVNNLSAAAQHLVDEAAARSDARKQALLAKKSQKNHAESDFDDHHDSRHKEKKVHGNSKIRKAADQSAGVGLGISNGIGTNGNPPKRRKVEKGPSGGQVMERALSGVFGQNGTAKKAASPRDTPPGDGPKKRNRGANATNGQTRKRNNTVTSAMSPSIASSPIRTTFPDIKGISTRERTPATNGGRPGAARGRQNSTQSMVENGQRPASPAPKQNGSGTATPNLSTLETVTGRSVPEVKTYNKEANNLKDYNTEPVEQGDPVSMNGGNRKEALKRESVEPMQPIQTQTITTTKSGRASKPSTPAIPSFPIEPVRSRSSRNALETASNNKRSHKKGAGAAAQQQLMAQQRGEEDDASSVQGDGDDEDEANEPRYCYCNGVSYGEMVGCDNTDGCEREWFHLECVGLKSAPSSKAKWYCDDCKEKLKGKRFQSR